MRVDVLAERELEVELVGADAGSELALFVGEREAQLRNTNLRAAAVRGGGSSSIYSNRRDNRQVRLEASETG